MPATVIDGKALAAATKAEAADKVRELKSRGINPCLAVILVGENPASQVYVRGKINDCAQCGIESRSINLPADTTRRLSSTPSRPRRTWTASRLSTWAVCRSESRATCPAPRRAASA